MEVDEEPAFAVFDELVVDVVEARREAFFERAVLAAPLNDAGLLVCDLLVVFLLDAFFLVVAIVFLQCNATATSGFSQPPRIATI